MYDFIKGEIAYKTYSSKGFFVTIETGGIGYLCEVIERDFKNTTENNELKLFTVLIHKEDKMTLCGFLKRQERDIFNTLTSVSGVGSKMALALINAFELSDLVSFVLNEDYKQLAKAKGIGPKLAQKIILELKDKLTSYENIETKSISNKSNNISSQNLEDARLVLLSLGYMKEEIEQVIEKVSSSASSNSSAEQILKEALQILALC